MQKTILNIILCVFYFTSYHQVTFSMENLNQYTEKDTDIFYSWGTATGYIDDSILIIENGTITDKDKSLFLTITASEIAPVQKIIFKNVFYEGSMDNMFDFAIVRRVTSIDLSGLNTTKVTSMENVFTQRNTYLTEVTFGNNISEESEITSTKQMFFKCSLLETVNLNGLDLTNNTNMSGMFYECQSLKEISWTNLSTSKVETMESLFNGCLNLESIDLTNFNTQNVTSMYRMFYTTTSLEEVSADNWDTSKVTTMEQMFYLCYELKSIHINNWSHQPVLESTRDMFHTNQQLKELHMQNFDTKNVKTTRQMFVNCGSLKELDASSFDTTNVTDYTNMFRSMNQLRELNISNFNTINAQEMVNMFAYDHYLQKITLGPNVFLNESTNLPPVGAENNTDRTDRPTSWVSMKNFVAYESTRSFLNDYTPIEDGEDTFIRGYPYTIEYYDEVTNNLLYQQIEITHENFYLSEYKNSRQHIDSWQLNGQNLDLESPYKNLGISVSTKPEMGKVTKLISSNVKDIEVESSIKWEGNNSNIQSINQDKSIPFWKDVILLKPTIDLNGDLENEEDIYYKMEIIDLDSKIKLEDKTIKTIANETNEIDFFLNRNDLIDVENIGINFYQLSFNDKVPISDTPNAQLFINVSIFDSFKIINYPSLFKWEFSQSNSVKVLERTMDNHTSLEILNSRFENANWRVKLQINAAEDIPFNFLWKANNEDSLTAIQIGEPFTIMNNKSSQTDDGYHYYNNWDSNYGLLMTSDELITPGIYGDNINILWMLENGPDFS